jgi:hypothetical protein
MRGGRATWQARHHQSSSSTMATSFDTAAAPIDAASGHVPIVTKSASDRKRTVVIVRYGPGAVIQTLKQPDEEP